MNFIFIQKKIYKKAKAKIKINDEFVKIKGILKIGKISNCSKGLYIIINYHPTNKQQQIKITIQHLQNANTKQQLRNQNDVFL